MIRHEPARTGSLRRPLLAAALLCGLILGCDNKNQEDAQEPAMGLETDEGDGLATEPAPVPPSSESEFPAFERSARVERLASSEPDLTLGAKGFQICAKCHGEGGFGSRDGAVPRLAGQHRRVLIHRMIEISEGLRVRPEMGEYLPAISSNEKIAGLAAFIEGLPDPVDPRQGAGTDLERGAKLYSEFCTSCHGGKGLGDGTNGIPRIGGWDVASVERTLQSLKSADAEIHETGMSDLVSMLTAEEIAAVADYVSRMVR